jgi:hypothetical protein
MKKIIKTVIVISILFSSCMSYAQFESYNDENIRFEYPGIWEKATNELILAFREHLDAQKNNYSGKLLELEIFILETSSNTILMFNKANVSKILTLDYLLNQRKITNKDALEAGYLSKINTLEIKEINGIQMLIEDFNANTGSNTGRSYTIRTIINNVIYEFTVAGLNNRDFGIYKGYLDNIIGSIIVKN